jgi:hypothetical protein
MPIPTPNDGEDKDKFISRCMSSDVMNREYPDGDQRLAVCNSQWKQSLNKRVNNAIRAAAGKK